MSNTDGWIGVDLDGTLATYTTWKGPNHIGTPVKKMLERVKQWVTEGKNVKIFTARASTPEQIPLIKTWLKVVGLPDLEVTCTKDWKMIELWDDRAVAVEKNTGNAFSYLWRP